MNAYATYRDIGGPDGYLARMIPFHGNSMHAERDDDGDYLVYSYRTVIAMAHQTGYGVEVRLDDRFYSTTTRRHQNLVKAWLGAHDTHIATPGERLVMAVMLGRQLMGQLADQLHRPELADVPTMLGDLPDAYGLTDFAPPYGPCIVLDRLSTLASDDYRLRQTLVHEAAHVLMGPFHGHDDAWLRTALALGWDSTDIGAPGPPEDRMEYARKALAELDAEDHAA